MFKNISTILIWSQDWKRLLNWYIDVLGLKPIEEINHPQDTGVLLEFAPSKTWLWIGKHSKVKGKNKDKYRIMFNIDVDSIDKTYKYLLAKKVKILAPPFKAPTFDKYFITFLDPDGNILQAIGPK